jgi:hypothetical protein
MVSLFRVVCRQPLLHELLNERENVRTCVLGHILLTIPAQSFAHVIDGVLSVKELPQINAHGVQAKTATGIGIKEHGPVVKLLPEHDERIGYGFFTVFHVRSLSFHSISLPTEQY